MTLTQLKAAQKWWNNNGHFNLDLLLKILEAKNK